MAQTASDEKEETNILPLRVITGGKGSPPGPDWLIHLEAGTVFLARPKGWHAPELISYTVIDKGTRTVKLTVHLTEKNFETWVDSNRFSNQYDKVEVLKEVRGKKKRTRKLEPVPTPKRRNPFEDIMK